MTKPAKRLCAQRRLRSESSLCAQWVAKDPSFLHADREDAQADLSLHQVHMPFCWFCLLELYEEFSQKKLESRTLDINRAQSRALETGRSLTVFRRSFDPNFGFPYMFYAFKLLSQAQIR